MPSPSNNEAGAALLIIDQTPIRRRAADEVRTLFSRLRQARRKVEDFESVDRPAFARWLRNEFHESLNQIGELQTKVDDAEDLVHEVQMIRFAMGCSYHQAYVNAMERKRLSDEATQDSREGEERERTRTSDDFYDERDEDERNSEHGAERADASGTEDRSETGSRGSAGEDEVPGLFRKAKDALGNVADKLKSKYRELARLLHPDLRFGGDAWTNDLWARAQSAYSEKDLRELEDLLVLSRVSLGPDAGQESVSDMQSAAVFLKKSLAAVRRQTTRLKHDMAWDFAALADRTRLKRKISYDLENEHDELRERLDVLEAQLARWSVPPARRSSNHTRRRSSWDLDF